MLALMQSDNSITLADLAESRQRDAITVPSIDAEKRKKPYFWLELSNQADTK